MEIHENMTFYVLLAEVGRRGMRMFNQAKEE
jgi:hypothetical protein